MVAVILPVLVPRSIARVPACVIVLGPGASASAERATLPAVGAPHGPEHLAEHLDLDVVVGPGHRAALSVEVRRLLLLLLLLAEGAGVVAVPLAVEQPPGRRPDHHAVHVLADGVEDNKANGRVVVVDQARPRGRKHPRHRDRRPADEDDCAHRLDPPNHLVSEFRLARLEVSNRDRKDQVAPEQLEGEEEDAEPEEHPLERLLLHHPRRDSEHRADDRTRDHHGVERDALVLDQRDR
mmetsp:Transcript_26732/g.60954  ORF Transcript_26732/g.60954 Transcript_26732/m.60954 type:complete len:238 (+) Transcript_26732:144-857(+)